MQELTKLELFAHLGYTKDPLEDVRFETSDMLRVRKILAMAIESRAMVAIIGPRGIGKSEAIKPVLKNPKLKVVTMEKSEQEKITSSDIETAMIFDLDPSEVPKGGERLGRQLRPILGGAADKGKVVLVIEEAQRLSSATLKRLKTLREKSWMGESRLFTVILVAHSDPTARAGLSEVKLRTDCVHMNGLAPFEAEAYVKKTIGRHFEDRAIELLSELPEANNFLDLQDLCVTLLRSALMNGREKVTAEDVLAISEKKPEPHPKAVKVTKAAPVRVSGKTALQAALEKRGGSAAEKEAAAC